MTLQSVNFPTQNGPVYTPGGVPAAVFQNPAFSGGRIAPADAFRPVSQAAKSVHFGRTSGTGRYGLYVSPEPVEGKQGGLGEVTGSVPRGINVHSDQDLRIMVPYLSPMKDKGYEATGVQVRLLKPGSKWVDYLLFFLPKSWRDAVKGMFSGKETFELMQKFDEKTNTRIYAVANEGLIGQYKDMYSDYKKGGTPMESILMFNRAVNAFLPYLDGSKKPSKSANFEPFRDGLDYVLANDWPVGYLMAGVEAYDPEMKTFFMMHNLHDKASDLKWIKNQHITVANEDGKTYSALQQGNANADVVIADENFAASLVNTALAKGALFVDAFRQKFENGKVFSMHHFLSPKFNPATHPALDPGNPGNQWSFVQLKNGEKGLSAFKKQNKLALQKMTGLNEDPDAVVFSWMARFDPFQKGFHMLMRNAKRLLDENPKAQLVIGGVGQFPGMDAFIDSLVGEDSPYKGRVWLPNEFVDPNTVARVMAGSDFTILPSLYEPYGLTQLEAMTMGSIPLVNAVDGLKSTLSDPEAELWATWPKDPKKYGQTAIMMNLSEVAEYREALSKIEKEESLGPADSTVLEKSDQEFTTAFNRAVQLHADRAKARQVRDNGFRYVASEHRIEPIVQRYVEIILGAFGKQPEEPETAAA